MRWAKSYSIIDHQILHGRYLHRLSHEAICLYLFLVVVGDREGKSFYSDVTIMDILRLTSTEFNNARLELEKERLIYYRRPYWIVRNIEAPVKERLSEGAEGTREGIYLEERSLR